MKFTEVEYWKMLINTTKIGSKTGMSVPLYKGRETCLFPYL